MNFLKKKASLLITLGFIGLFVYYFANNLDSFRQLLHVPLLPIMALVALKFLRVANSSRYLTHTLAAYSKNIPARESFYLALLSSIGNFFGPLLGGASIRAVYLKKKYKFSYTNFAATLSGLYIITFIVNASIGLLSLAAIHMSEGMYSWILYIAFAAWLIGAIVLAEIRSIHSLMEFLGGKLPFLKPLLKHANNIIKGWQVVRQNKRLFYKLNKLMFQAFLISYATVYFEFVAVDAPITLAPLALYTTLSSLSTIISFTPGAIGVREALFIFSNQLLGLNVDQILQIAIIDRSLTFLVMAVAYLAIKLKAALRPGKPSGKLPV